MRVDVPVIRSELKLKLSQGRRLSARCDSASSNRDFHGLRRAVSFKWMDATRDAYLVCF